ncbi:MAG: UvrD-helicase domain-containing protein [Clostridium perfringens]
MIATRERLREVLCKRTNCTHNIHECDGKLRHRCLELSTSFINNLNNDQLKYITSSIDENIFLKACPGSGKTEVLGIKSAYEINLWEKKHRGIAILTFTNSAEDEIRNRVEKYLDEKLKYPNYIGTFTSWIHGYIANPFLSKVTHYKGDKDSDKSIKLIESGNNSDFIKIFSSRYGYSELKNINPCEYYFDLKLKKIIYCGSRSNNGQEILEKLIKSDKWRLNDLKKIKRKFFEKGFYLYEDIEYLVYKLLYKNEEISKMIASRFPIILLDECQDLSYIQLEIIKLINKQGSKIHLIGDLDQAIYGFRNIDPNDTIEFIDSLEFRKMELTQNYRSCQSIVDISGSIINRNSTIVGCAEQNVTEPLVVILYKKDKEIEASKEFTKLIIENNLSIKNSRIIVRGNSLKYKLLGLKNQNTSSNTLEDIARAIYLSVSTGNVSEFKISFELFAKAIQRIYFSNVECLNKQYFYKPAEMEMHEWKELLYDIKNILISNEELLDFSKTWSNWKDKLKKIMDKSISILPSLNEKECKLGNIKRGNKDKTLEEVLFCNTSNDIEHKIETIHGCKGMSLDAALFMSVYAKSRDEDSGAHWKDWFDVEEIGEKNRLAYVAFSRARQMLVLGIPRTSTFSEEDKKNLIQRGFKIIEL